MPPVDRVVPATPHDRGQLNSVDYYRRGGASGSKKYAPAKRDNIPEQRRGVYQQAGLFIFREMNDHGHVVPIAIEFGSLLLARRSCCCNRYRTPILDSFFSNGVPIQNGGVFF